MKHSRIWCGLFCLLICLGLHAQRFGFNRQPFTPVPDHDYADLLIADLPWTTNTPPTMALLSNAVAKSPLAGAWYLRFDGPGGAGGNDPLLCWHVASNSDITFPKPIRVGSRMITSTGTNWLRFKFTNGLTENIRFIKPPFSTFGDTLWTNSVIRFVYQGAITNPSNANIDLVLSDAGPFLYFQLLTGPSGVGVWAHSGDGNSTNAVTLTNFVPYFCEYRINHLTRNASLTVRNADGSTNGVMVPVMTNQLGASWEISLQANYHLNDGAINGHVMVGGFSISYTDQ